MSASARELQRKTAWKVTRQARIYPTISQPAQIEINGENVSVENDTTKSCLQGHPSRVCQEGFEAIPQLPTDYSTVSACRTHTPVPDLLAVSGTVGLDKTCGPSDTCILWQIRLWQCFEDPTGLSLSCLGHVL